MLPIGSKNPSVVTETLPVHTDVTEPPTDGTGSSDETPSELLTEQAPACNGEHTVLEWTIEHDAVCFTGILRNGSCLVCGELITEVVEEKKPHSYEKGYCTRCGMVEGANENFIIEEKSEEGGTHGARLVTYTGNEVGRIILPNVAYLPSENSIVPVTRLASGLFEGRPDLQEVVIPDTVHTIEVCAFADCIGLTSIHIPANVSNLHGGVFLGCTALTTLTVDERNLWYTAHGNCIIQEQHGAIVVGGKNAVIPSDGSVQAIGNEAFAGRGIQSLTIPDSIHSIGAYAFAECKDLVDITLPANLTELGDHAFFECEALQSVFIPDAVETLGYKLFAGCHSLKTLRLPSGLREIGEKVLWECQSLERIDFDGTVTRWNDIRYAFVVLPTKGYVVFCTNGRVTMPPKD